MLKYITIVLILFVHSMGVELNAQSDTSKSFLLLDEAIGWMSTEGGAIYFGEIAMGLENPEDIFNVPAYRVMMGGYWIAQDDKLEMYVSDIKALSDGILMTIINESANIIYIDSVRTESPLAKDTTISISNIMDEQFGDGDLNYLGEVMLNGVSCHKIKTSFDKVDISTYYWVSTKDKKLVMFADYQNGRYDTYRIKKITNVPGNHDFSVKLPDHEIDELYGYQVIDMRFAEYSK